MVSSILIDDILRKECEESPTGNILGIIHIWHPWKLSNFQDPPPPCPSTKFSHPLDLGRPIPNDLPPPTQFQTKASLSAFTWLYTLVCVVVQKYHEMSSLFIITHIFSSHFAINLFYLHKSKIPWLIRTARAVLKHKHTTELFKHSTEFFKHSGELFKPSAEFLIFS